jgi:putative tryptophan/tyrosine transport system substrate-binding protein
MAQPIVVAGATAESGAAVGPDRNHGARSYSLMVRPVKRQPRHPAIRAIVTTIKPVHGVGGKRVRRRDFIQGLGGAAMSAPFAGFAQQAGKPPMIGFLGASSRVAISSWTDAFVRRLGELGWIDGRSVAIVYRWAEGRPERARELAKELVGLGVNVIVTHANAGVTAAKQATSTIPIVFGAAGDPVDAGLVTNITHPEANVTGLSLQQTDTAAKRLEIMRELLPDLRRLGILTNPNNRGAVLELTQVETAAKALGLEITSAKLRSVDDIPSAFDTVRGRVDALYFCNDPLLTNSRIPIAIMAAAARLPTMFNFRENVDAGGLISYGANLPEMFRRAAEMVDKILRGAKPGDLPVQQPTKFDLVINSTTARALGIALPPPLIARADEVID